MDTTQPQQPQQPEHPRPPARSWAWLQRQPEETQARHRARVNAANRARYAADPAYRAERMRCSAEAKRRHRASERAERDIKPQAASNEHKQSDHGEHV